MAFTERKKSDWGTIAALATILALALSLRIWGVGYGLPHSYILDETFVVNHALAFGTGDLNPHFFEWPGSLLMYLLFGLYGCYFVLGLAFGLFRGPEDFALAFLSDPTPFYLIGRTFTVLVSTLTVYAAFVVGKRCYDRETGLLAALLLSVSPLLCGVSHFTLTDTPVAFLTLLAFIPVCRAAKEGGLSHYALAGLLIGLAASVKYNAAALLLPFAVAHAVYVWQTPGLGMGRLILDRRVPLALAALLAGFIVGCPFSILDSRKFLEDILFQFSRVHSLGNINAEVASPLVFYLKVALAEGVGLGITVAALAALPWACRRRERVDLVLVSFVLGYLLYLCRWRVAVDKYLIPVVPVLAIVGAAFLIQLQRSCRLRFRWANLVAVPVLAFLIAPPLNRSIQIDRTLVQKDTRDLAKEWIERNIPQGTKIAIDSGRFDVAKLSPPLEEAPDSLYETYVAQAKRPDNRLAGAGKHLLRRYYELKSRSASGKGYPLTRIVISSEGKIDPEISVERFIGSKVRYVVASSYAFEGYSSPAYRDNHPEAASYYARFYRSLDSRCTLVKVFPREPHKRQGPAIKIYRVPLSGRSA